MSYKATTVTIKAKHTSDKGHVIGSFRSYCNQTLHEDEEEKNEYQ